MPGETGDVGVLVRLRAALASALQARDRTSVDAIRGTMAAIANAEAVEASLASPRQRGPIASAVPGLGAADVPRKVLTEAEMIGIAWSEVVERRRAATDYEQLGKDEDAARLRAQAATIEALLRGNG
jgi:uncharacterized protein YqeY